MPATESAVARWQTEADLLADARDFLERLCNSARYRYLYPDGPNLALLFTAYQELDRRSALGRAPKNPRKRSRLLRNIVRHEVLLDVDLRNQRLRYRYPHPRPHRLPVLSPAVLRALTHVDRDVRDVVANYITGAPSHAGPVAQPPLRGAAARGYQQFTEALVNAALAEPSSIRSLHPQYIAALRSAPPTKRRHPIATFFLLKLPLQLVLLLFTLFNLGYLGAYYFFNNETLGRFVSSKVSNILNGDLEMGSIHWNGRLIFDLLLGQPTPVEVRNVSVWEPYKQFDATRKRRAAYTEQIDLKLTLHEIIPWNRLGVPTVFEIPWVLHFSDVQVETPMFITVREYDQGKQSGEILRLIGLRDAFRLRDTFAPPSGQRGLSVAVDEAELAQTILSLDFTETRSWATSLNFDTSMFGLRFDAPDPKKTKPVRLPFAFWVQGTAGRGPLQLGRYEFPISAFDLDQFECGFGQIRVSDVGMRGDLNAAGSAVHIEGVLHDIFTRPVDPNREPLSLDAEVDYGYGSTLDLAANSPNIGPLTRHLLEQFGVDPNYVDASNSPATARIVGPMEEPAYEIAAENLTIRPSDDDALVAHNVVASATLSRQIPPDVCRPWYPADEARYVAEIDTLRGDMLEGSFTLSELADHAKVVLPTKDEPFCLAGELDIAGINPGRALARTQPTLASALDGRVVGTLLLDHLVVANKPIEGQDPGEGPPETETTIEHSKLHIASLELIRSHKPEQDGLPRRLSADGTVGYGQQSGLEIDELTLSTEGARLRIDGGTDPHFETLNATHLRTQIDDGDAFAAAFALPHLFDRLSAELSVHGPIWRPTGPEGQLWVSGLLGGDGETQAAISMTDGTFRLRTPNAKLADGRGPVDLEVTLFENQGLARDPKLRAQASLQDLDFGKLSGNVVQGRGTIDFEVGDGSGRMARVSELRARGQVYANELEVYDYRFPGTTAAFAWTGNELAVEGLIIPIHRPVSPEHAPNRTVRIGTISAEGSILLVDDPELDLMVKARGVPLSLLTKPLALETPVLGALADGTALHIGGQLTRPTADGTVAVRGLAISGIAFGDGHLAVTSQDVPPAGPLAGHRELDVHGELSVQAGRTLGSLLSAIDATVAIGHPGERGGAPPIAVELDARFDEIDVRTLLVDPVDRDAALDVHGALEGLSAHLLRCNAGTPLLSSCVGDNDERLAIELRIDRSWLGSPPKRGEDPCARSGTLCSTGPLIASIDWPMVELLHPWRFREGGNAAGEAPTLALSGRFDFEAPAETANAQPSTGGRTAAHLEGSFPMGALAKPLERYSIRDLDGTLEVDLAMQGYALSPRVRGTLELGKTIQVQADKSDAPVRITEFEAAVQDGWLQINRAILQTSRGGSGSGGTRASGSGHTSQLRLGQNVSKSGSRSATQIAFMGPQVGQFELFATGTVGNDLLALAIPSGANPTTGSIQVDDVRATGRIADPFELWNLEGSLSFAQDPLELEFENGISSLTLEGGNVFFQRGRSGPSDWIAVYLGRPQHAFAEHAPSSAVQARVGRMGRAWLWGRFYVSPTFDQLADTSLQVVLKNAPIQSFDGRGPVYEAELSTNNLRLHGNDPTVISGDITLTRARYVKDVIEGADLLQVTESVPTAEAPPPDILRNLQLDLNLTTQEPLEIENNIASGVEADAAVRITGRYDDPDLQGRIDFERGGEVDIPFLRGTFEIDRGRVNLDREVGDARVDVVAQRRESTFSESRGIQLRLFGTLSAIRWSCSHPGDTSGNLDTVRGCTEYLVLGRGEGQISDPDVQRFGQGGLSNAHKPLQVAGNITEIDLGERLSDAAPRFRTYIPELRIRAGEIGPEIESRTPVQWFDFYYGHATLGATYTRGYPGFLLRQSSDVNVQLHILDPITLEYSLRNRSYLNDRVIFDPREQQTLELRFDLRFPSLR